MKFSWKKGLMVSVLLGAVLLAVMAWRSVGLVLAEDVELKSATSSDAAQIFAAVKRERDYLASIYYRDRLYRQWFDTIRAERVVSVEVLTKMRTLAVARTHEGRDYQLKLTPDGWKVSLTGARPK
jgi:hypothetical protein